MHQHSADIPHSKHLPQTWTSGEKSMRLAHEVARAMSLGIPILLAHEMPGVGGQVSPIRLQQGSGRVPLWRGESVCERMVQRERAQVRLRP